MEVNYKSSTICITNSIMKYFGLEPYHETLDYLDDLFYCKKYENVVLLVLDGLGNASLNEIMPKKSFLKENRIMVLSTVFPTTTTAATTSLLTGLTPSEHNWCGWDMYFKDTDETISLYPNKLKDTRLEPKLKVQDRPYMKFKSIVDLINEKGEDKAYYAYPFDKEHPCLNIDEVCDRIINLCQEPGKKFIYGYTEAPDKLFHQAGIHSSVAKESVIYSEKVIKEMCTKLKDTLVIITADHGLVKSRYINIKNDIKELYDMLERTTCLESRATAIKLKDNVKKEDFIEVHNKYLNNSFILLSKEEVLENNLFGFNKSPYLEDTLGDYLLIATRNMCLNYDDNSPIFKANHGGLTKQELMVPVIMIDRKKARN